MRETVIKTIMNGDLLEIRSGILQNCLFFFNKSNLPINPENKMLPINCS